MESVRGNGWDMIWIHSGHVRINLKYTFKVFYKLTIKEIKITLRILFTLEIMAFIKKAIETKCW